jgi:hypothetical protein
MVVNNRISIIDQTLQQDGKSLTYQGTYRSSYLSQPYIINQH